MSCARRIFVELIFPLLAEIINGVLPEVLRALALAPPFNKVLSGPDAPSFAAIFTGSRLEPFSICKEAPAVIRIFTTSPWWPITARDIAEFFRSSLVLNGSIGTWLTVSPTNPGALSFTPGIDGISRKIRDYITGNFP